MTVKVTELTELATTPDSSDLLYIVDSSESPSAASKKISVQNLLSAAPGIGTDPVVDSLTANVQISAPSVSVTSEISFEAGSQIVEDAANQIAIRVGATAQSFAVYRTSTSGNSVYERVRLVADGTRFFLRPETSGGTLRPLIVRMAPQTVAALPTASSAGTGARAVVSDASSPTFGQPVTGGGSTLIPVYSDGSSWRVG